MFAGAIEQWADDSRHPRVLGQLLAYQGALYLQLSDYPSAKAALERSQPLLRNHNLSAERAFCLVNLANVARREGDYEETARLSREALALARELQDPWGITHALLQLGLSRYRQGDVGEAETLLEESFAVATDDGNPRLIIAPLNVLGDIACHRGDYGVGRARLERCLTLTRELDDPAKIAVALNNLGTVFHVLEKLDEAQAAYEESLEICREIGDGEGQAIALSNLGEVACAAGDYAEAARRIRWGLAIGRDIDDQWTVMACLNSLGEIAIRMGDEAQAWASFAEALEIAQATQTLPFLLKVLVNLAVLLAGEGDGQLAAEALSLARRHHASEEATKEKANQLMKRMGLPAGETISRPLEAVVAEAVARTTTRRARMTGWTPDPA